jgi:hypothetical protein
MRVGYYVSAETVDFLNLGLVSFEPYASLRVVSTFPPANTFDLILCSPAIRSQLRIRSNFVRIHPLTVIDDKLVIISYRD